MPLLVEANRQIPLSLVYRWKQLIDLSSLADPVEEVYAVWSSLKAAQGKGLLSEEERIDLAAAYKANYSLYFDNFTALYDAFHEVAEKIDIEAAFVLAFDSLNTLTPKLALEAMLSAVNKFLKTGRSLNSVDTAIDICSPIVESYNSSPHVSTALIYSEVISEDSLFRNMKRKAYWRKVQQTPLVFRFDEEGLEFYIGPGEDFSHGQFSKQFWYIFGMESIFQQLVTGNGLLCPFRYIRWKTGKCCRQRRMLEGILKHVQGPKDTWYPRDCLKL